MSEDDATIEDVEVFLSIIEQQGEDIGAFTRDFIRSLVAKLDEQEARIHTLTQQVERYEEALKEIAGEYHFAEMKRIALNAMEGE